MKPLRLLILFLCGCLLAFGFGYLWEVKNDLDDLVREPRMGNKEGYQTSKSGKETSLLCKTIHSKWYYGSHTPPRWIKDLIAWDKARGPRRIEEWRMYDRKWRQVGVIYNGEVYNLGGEKMGCL